MLLNTSFMIPNDLPHIAWFGYVAFFFLTFFRSFFWLPFSLSYSTLSRSHSLCVPFVLFERHITIPLSCQIVCFIFLQVYFSFFFFSVLLLVLAYPLAFSLFAARVPFQTVCVYVLLLNSQCVNIHMESVAHTKYVTPMAYS